VQEAREMKRMLKKRGSLRWRWSFGQTKIEIREKRTQRQLQRCSGSHLKKRQRLRQLAEHWENHCLFGMIVCPVAERAEVLELELHGKKDWQLRPVAFVRG
jgi:hypothetical protein